MDQILDFLNNNFTSSLNLLNTILNNYTVTENSFTTAASDASTAAQYYEVLTTPPVIPSIKNPYTYINYPSYIPPVKFSMYCSKQQCTSGVTKQQGNISKKMLQSKMIKYNGNHKIKYSNSKTDTINATILSENEDLNKSLLLHLSYSVYYKYFEPLSKVNRILNIMLNNILASLSIDEYIKVFCLHPITPPISILPPIIVAKTYYLVTRQISGIRYFIFKNYSDDEPLVPSFSYVFNLEHQSNLDTQLSFSINKEGDSSPYMTIVGVAGTPGAYAMVTVPIGISVDTIYPFNVLITDPYQKYELWAYTYNGIHIQTNVVAPKNIATACNGITKTKTQEITPLSYLPDIDKTYNLVCLTASSLFSIYDYNGPRISIKDIDNHTSTIFYSYNKYALYTGKYYIYIPKIYSIALLNSDQTGSITYTGDMDKMTKDTVLGTTSDGEYSFYYGTIVITVTGPFSPISLYTRDFGYMHGKNIIIYSDTCPLPQENPRTIPG